MNTIVWIHGFPLSSAIFEEQRGIAGAQHVMPDLPGFGSEPAESPSPQPAPRAAATGSWSIDDYARFVLERSPAKAIFAGLSMGGYVAFAIQRLAPERVEGLILLDTRETADAPDARKGRYDTIEKVREQGIAPVVESMLPKMLTAAAPEAMRERVRRIMSSTSPAGAMAALEAMAERPDSSPLLPSITVPVLIVVGDQDSITPPSDAERMAKAIPNATLVTIAGAAHLSTVEKPHEVNDAVANWLR